METNYDNNYDNTSNTNQCINFVTDVNISKWSSFFTVNSSV